MSDVNVLTRARVDAFWFVSQTRIHRLGREQTVCCKTAFGQPTNVKAPKRMRVEITDEGRT